MEPKDDPIVVELLRIMRAHDPSGVWDGIPDAALLEPSILTPERRQALPLIANPDQKTLWRLEMFYTAVALTLERRTGLPASPVLKLHEEGWGQLLLVVGKLVAASATLRDVHRFGFPSLAKLVERGHRLVDQAAKTIERFPDAAAA